MEQDRERRRPGRRRGIWAVVLLGLGALLVVGGGWGSGLLSKKEYDLRSVPGASMDPAYPPGSEVWLERLVARDVARGEVALLAPPASWGVDGDLLKRVVAVGGDRISWAKGDAALTLNGKPLVEPYLKDPAVPAVVPFDVTVPEGRMFVMGDNRINSADSHMRIADDGGSVPMSAAWGVAVDAPTGLLAAGAVALLGVPVLLTGGGLGIASLVARRRAARRTGLPSPAAL
ncbi:signal peptidase I [Streptomyces sp. NPDC051555]|uniref:signal peptidase I n=1 Tax=Streptomyces sp. NPDC051555 TaxID=3365657 RepID=UPI00379BAAC0